MPQPPPRYLALLLFLAAIGMRLPTLGLPLEGPSAVLASLADQLGHARGWALHGHAPLLPLCASILVGSGLSATVALRLTDAVLVALLAPLVAGLATRLGADRRTAVLSGVVMALHPLALVQAGGVAPGTETAGALLLVLSVRCLLSPRPALLRLGTVLALALPLADASGWIYGPLLGAFALRRESSPRARVVLGGLAMAVLLLAPVRPTALLSDGALVSGMAAALLWLVAATLGTLLLWLPAGFARLSEARGRTSSLIGLWLLGGALHLVLLAARWGGEGVLAPWVTAGAALALLPPLVLLGTWGLSESRAPARMPAARAIVVGAFGCSILLAWGGLQAFVSPGPLGAAGRLHLLRRAMTAAARTAGESGWIVLSVSEGRAAEQTSLADLAADHWTWSEHPARDQEPPLRRLVTFPARALEPGRSVAVVARAGTSGDVHTFGGAAIFHQEVVAHLGPYVVLRAQRPDSTPDG